MTLDDYIELLGDTERALRKRRRATTDIQEKKLLREQIQAIRDKQDFADLVALTNIAADLNGVARVVEAATAALRERPFDQTLGAYQRLLDRIGQATGENQRRLRNAFAYQDPDASLTGSADDGRPTDPTDDTLASAAERAAPPVSEGQESPAARLAGLYHSMEIRAEKLPEIDYYYIAPITRNRSRYEQVGTALGLPWYVIAVIHGLECTFSFETHLHNGDPLAARTVRVPSGRPTSGAPPFSWLESATDALRLKGLDGLEDWSIGLTLDRLEHYNGLGYRFRRLPSPYLWSYSTFYEKGKFISDGKFDPNKLSKQCGAAVMIKRLEQRGMLVLDRPLDTGAGRLAALGGTRPPPESGDALDLPSFVKSTAKAELAYPGPLSKGARDRERTLSVHRVQEWCSFHGATTEIDGIFGSGTEMAVQRFQADQDLPETGTVDEAAWAAMIAPMHRALTRIDHPSGTTIYDAVLAVARQHLAERPVEFQAGGEGNIGPWVRLYMLGKQGASQAWCAGFVSHVIGQAAHDLGIAVPIPRQVGVDALVQDAKTDGRFLAESAVAGAQQRLANIPAGALFCRRRSSTDWNHTGIVTQVEADAFNTIEGNTNKNGSSEGVEVRRRSRPYDNIDFVLLLG